MKDFSLQGKVYLGASLAGGKPGAMHWVNCRFPRRYPRKPGRKATRATG